MTAKLLIFSIVISFTLTLPLRAGVPLITAQLSETGDRVTVKIDGQPFAEYVTKSNTRPILWPIFGPTGKRMTRDYPMVQGTKETSDHVHHRSLWFAHGNVNGIDFWDEKPEAGLTQGTIAHRKFAKIESGARALIVTENEWLGPAGKKVAEDERRLTFGTWGDSRWIDFDITVRASEVSLVFNDTKEGTFGVRVAEALRVLSKQGAVIVNSNGLTNDAAWGKPADWVDDHGTIDGDKLGVAIFNHPSSFRYPTGWHVRTYGLFAANPFAERAFGNKSANAVSYTLPKGEKLVLCYRVFLHPGDEKQGKVAEAFADYAKLKK
jgi:hypothetical protein